MQVIGRRVKVLWMDDCLSDRPVVQHNCVTWLSQGGCDPHTVHFCRVDGLRARCTHLDAHLAVEYPGACSLLKKAHIGVPGGIAWGAHVVPLVAVTEHVGLKWGGTSVRLKGV